MKIDARTSTQNPTHHLITELIEAWNSHDVERLAECYDASYQGMDVAQPNPHAGILGLRKTVFDYFTAFPDLHFDVEDSITEGHRSVVVWTARGTHRGPFMRIPPTNRSIAIRGTSILMLKNNKVHRADYIWDVAGLLRSIGLLPELR